MTRPIRIALGAVLLALALAPPATAEETRIWIGVRSGVIFYNDTDPQPLEDLATFLSDPEAGRAVDFEDKPWEIPIGLRVGARLNKSINLFALFERQPYLLEQSDLPPRVSGGLAFSSESTRMEAPSNLFGGGIDFRLGSEGKGQSVLLGVSLGTFSIEGKDQDANGFQNLAIDGSGSFYEATIAVEYEFNEELSIYPFGAYRYMKTSSTSARDVRNPVETDIPEFEIDFTGFTVGVEIRFRIYPWGESTGDPSDF